MEPAVKEEKVFVAEPAVINEEKVSVAVPAVKEEEEKVFVAVPAEPRAGQSTLLWVLAHLYSSRATTIVVTHVHVPPQMIPIMGVKFHVSKMSADQVRLFRMAERQQVEEMLDDYIHRCSEIKVKCEKLVIENEDVASGLVELIRLHGITKLVIAAAADKQYSKKLNKPVSKTATEMMQRADPSCKIWFVCKEKLICVRDKEVIAPSAAAVGQEVARLPFDQKEGNINMEMGLDDEVEEARKALAELMSRALKESCRRQKADEEVAAYLQKAKVYEELYLEEVRKREELEAALARADREIAQLRRAFGQRNTPTEGPQHVMPTRSSSILAQHTVFLGDDAKKSDLGPEGWQPAEPAVNGGRELEALLSHRRIRKVIPLLSPLSVIPSPPP